MPINHKLQNWTQGLEFYLSRAIFFGIETPKMSISPLWALLRYTYILGEDYERVINIIHSRYVLGEKVSTCLCLLITFYISKSVDGNFGIAQEEPFIKYQNWTYHRWREMKKEKKNRWRGILIFRFVAFQ